VATTELITFTQLQSEFAKRGVRIFALSANNTRGRWGGFESHATWVKDIDELSSTPIQFPIISDTDGSISRLFNVYVV
jgi:alkyl hydroperoxide reductase subunit AhpC